MGITSAGASHLKGPLYGSDQAAGGLWEDLAVGGMNARHGRYFYDSCVSNSLANYWVATNIVAGTTAMSTAGIQLTHNVANQGPSIRFVANPTGPVETNLYLGADPGTNDRQNIAAIEGRIAKFSGTSTGGDGYFGFGSAAAAHPLDVNGVPTVASIGDGAGWIWTATNTPTPVLWDNGTVRTLPSVGTMPVLANTGMATSNIYGVRIVTTNLPRDIVSWYVNGRRVLTTSPGATATGQFLAPMTAYFGIVHEAGAAQTFALVNFAFGSAECPLV